MALGVFIFICFCVLYYRIKRLVEEKYSDIYMAIKQFKVHLQTSNWLFDKNIHGLPNDIISALATVIFYAVIYIFSLAIFSFIFLFSLNWGQTLTSLLSAN